MANALADMFASAKERSRNALAGAMSDYSRLPENYPNAQKFMGALKSNVSQHIPSNADFRNPVAMSKWAQAAALNAPMSGIVGYRGLDKPFNKSQKNSLEWYSENPSIANIYAGTDEGANIIKKDIGPIEKNAFDFGFRDSYTEVNASDIKSRIKQGILEKFQLGSLKKEKAISLIDDLNNIKSDVPYKSVHRWWSEHPEITEILKKSGYDAIHNLEQGVPTYGVFNKGAE